MKICVPSLARADNNKRDANRLGNQITARFNMVGANALIRERAPGRCHFDTYQTPLENKKIPFIFPGKSLQSLSILLILAPKVLLWIPISTSI